MFSAWKEEKATAALVDEAAALADKLAAAKPHFVESHAAAAQVWAAVYLANGKSLHDLMTWSPSDVAKFISSAQGKIAALRKKREYDSSDGLLVWLQTARAVAEPRILPHVREIWQHIMSAGPNADAMAEDLVQDAGLLIGQGRRVPLGFGAVGQSDGVS